MKQNILIRTLCYLLLPLSSLFANEMINPANEAENFRPTGKEVRMLHKLLELDDHELAKLRQTIERIERMSPEERDQLRERIVKIQRMPPERVAAMRRNFKTLPKEEREAMRNHFMQIGPKEHAELRPRPRPMRCNECQALLREERLALPPPFKDNPAPSSDTVEQTP